MSNIIQPTTKIYGRTGVVTVSGILLSENSYRTGVIIQNLATAVLFIKFGVGASDIDFDLVLKGGAGNDDGLGGTLSFDVLSYTGIISVAGSSVRCTATEF